MADLRLYNPATRFYLASPLAFADWQNPTAAELNANPTNDPNGLIWELTCALDQADTTFDLGDSEVDDSLSFCQVAGASTPITYSPEISYTIFRSKDRWEISDPTSFNTANLAFSLLAWRGIEYFAIASVGEEPGVDFAVGQRVKMARVATDFITDVAETGGNVRATASFLRRGDVNWNFEIQA